MNSQTIQVSARRLSDRQKKPSKIYGNSNTRLIFLMSSFIDRSIPLLSRKKSLVYIKTFWGMYCTRDINKICISWYRSEFTICLKSIPTRFHEHHLSNYSTINTLVDEVWPSRNYLDFLRIFAKSFGTSNKNGHRRHRIWAGRPPTCGGWFGTIIIQSMLAA